MQFMDDATAKETEKLVVSSEIPNLKLNSWCWQRQLALHSAASMCSRTEQVWILPIFIWDGFETCFVSVKLLLY